MGLSASQIATYVAPASRHFWQSRILTRSVDPTGNRRQRHCTITERVVGVNLRNFKGDYSVGLDMGTGSVGWSVTDEDGNLLHFKKQPTWGSRLFDSAQTAAEARTPRGQRRRYVRRRWRLDLLQSLLQEEIERVDPDFFLRLRQSRLVNTDPNKTTSDYRWPLFNGSDFTEVDYYNKFPTIYHLRKWLMETDEQADIRLVYLALHNIVKHRGNFLREGQKLSSENANPDDAVSEFCTALKEWCEGQEGDCGALKEADIVAVLTARGMRPSDRAADLLELLPVSFGDGDKQADKKLKKALASAMVGLKAEFKDIFGDFATEGTKISLSKDEESEALLEVCPDEGKVLFESLQRVYSAYVLQGLLSYAPGESISANMIAKYDQYAKDLRMLKLLVREYAPASYGDFFRGPLCPNKGGYDKFDASVKGYTRYNLGVTSYDDFAKEVKKLFVGTGAEDDERYESMMDAFDDQRFLRRLKTSDNGSICYQLHLEEMEAILDNQGRFYPTLANEKDKLLSLVTFRIPYYVGPLTQRNAREDAHGKLRFAWSERKPGTEGVTITPWNWEDVIDKGASAEKFITRMTGICTYLQGEDVLPKSSLLYEEFCVLNELNGMRWTSDGDEERRFDAEQREGMMRDLFRKTRTVSNKRIEDWLVQNGYAHSPKVSGGQNETGLESKLGSYIFFAKDIFGTDEIAKVDYPMVEEIILWNTLFEDRSILKEKLREKYGDAGEGRLSAEQIRKICKKRFTGWGRLSKKFLTGLKVDTQLGEKSIMDVLREGDPDADIRRGRTMVLMEVIRDDNLGFQKKIDSFNRAYFAEAGSALGVNDLPGSPAIRRSLNQAIRIVDEIAHIAGHAPTNVFIEVTRDDDMGKKGHRTARRYDQLKEALAAFKKDDPQIWKEIQAASPTDLDERLTLYFMQRGKCMYSGKPIDINQLSNAGLYEVDHIIPRSYIKDDSFENKALVLREFNQRKTDSMLLDDGVRRNMAGYWRSLHDAKLIGDKKFNNLMRTHVGENAMRGFIARQLVETSQMVKLAQSLLSAKYPDTKITPVKASMSHDLREAAGFVKCREANDFHHAHDAFLACRVGLFIRKWYPDMYDKPILYTRAMRKYVREQAEEFRKTRRAPGSSGFVVGRFMSSFVDADTGELWEGAEEVEGIRRVLNYRQCHVTRMPMEDSGAFWDATIYSPRDPKMGGKLSLRLKSDLPVEVYGGYSRQQFAYFFIYEARDKKGRPAFRFSQVPVWLASRIASEEGALEKYAREQATSEQLEFVRIQRSKILKKQLIEIDGERFVVTGKKEMRNAVQIAFSGDEISCLREFISKKEEGPHYGNSVSVSPDELLRSIKSHKRFANRLLNQIKIDDIQSNNLSLDEDGKMEIVLRILALINGSANMVDLSLAGGSKYSGCLHPNYNKLLNDPNTDFFIVDQSVTGMFERRTRVGL